MSDKELLERLEAGVSSFMAGERDSLTRGLNERNISANLANYLGAVFLEYNVDAEYNGDIDKPNDRKALDIARNRMIEIGKEPNALNNYKVSPDIIIHRRRTNEHNLAVIEVKKDISPAGEIEYDLIKLEHLTIDFLGNHYNYRLGLFIVFGTGKNAGSYSLRCFRCKFLSC